MNFYTEYSVVLSMYIWLLFILEGKNIPVLHTIAKTLIVWWNIRKIFICILNTTLIVFIMCFSRSFFRFQKFYKILSVYFQSELNVYKFIVNRCKCLLKHLYLQFFLLVFLVICLLQIILYIIKMIKNGIKKLAPGLKWLLLWSVNDFLDKFLDAGHAWSFKLIWGHLKLFQAIWGHFGLFKNLLGPLSFFEVFWGQLRAYFLLMKSRNFWLNQYFMMISMLWG